MLFTGLTYLIYNGQKHRRLASQMEEKFIGFSLRVASPRPIKHKNQIVTISLKEEDLKYLPHIIKKDFTDVTPEIYASILQKLIEMKAKYIVVSWRLNFDSDHESWLPLEQVLANAPPSTKIVFAVPAILKKFIPDFLLRYGTVVENETCQSNTQLICMYGAHWDDWIIQTIANDFWLDRDLKTSEHMISFNLPRMLPSYLLYLNSTEDFESLTFSQLLFLNSQNKNWQDKAVFIGNALWQGKPGMSKSQDIQKVATALTPSHADIRTQGTPFNEFWAQIAQLFIDQDLVTIVPYKWSLTIAILFASIIVFFLNIFGPPVALGLFLSCTALSPLLNALFIRFWHFYLPLFDLTYAGLWSFIILTFAKLSLESFRAWQLNVQQHHDRETADSKSNFISLISHNLNTPVAKMLGLLDLLIQMPIDAEMKEDTKIVIREITRIQICIRAVLVATSIDDNRLNNESMTGDMIVKEFSKLMQNPLKRLGLKVTIELTAASCDLAYIPMRFDKRALCTVLGALAILLNDSKDEGNCQLKLTIAEYEHNNQTSEILICEAFTQSAPLSSRIIDRITKVQNPKEEAFELPILAELCVNLINSVKRSYQGMLETNTQNNMLRLSLIPAKNE